MCSNVGCQEESAIDVEGEELERRVACRLLGATYDDVLCNSNLAVCSDQVKEHSVDIASKRHNGVQLSKGMTPEEDTCSLPGENIKVRTILQ